MARRYEFIFSYKNLFFTNEHSEWVKYSKLILVTIRGFVCGRIQMPDVIAQYERTEPLSWSFTGSTFVLFRVVFLNLSDKVPRHCAILDNLGSAQPRNQHWLILFAALAHMNGPCSWNLPLNVSLSLGTLVIYAHLEDKLSDKLSLLSCCAQKNSQSSTADERSIQCLEQKVFLRTL